MRTVVIPYWLLKEEIQVVMDKIGNPGQKVSGLLFVLLYTLIIWTPLSSHPATPISVVLVENFENTENLKGQENPLTVLSFDLYLNQSLGHLPAKMAISLMSLS